jgi:DNA replication protein DnaC
MRLKLARMNEVLDAVVSLAEADKMSYLSFLDRLFEEEVAAKERRRIGMAMRMTSPFILI